MDSERKIYINEEHPLNGPAGATKIYLNAGKSRKLDSPADGTVIHLNTDKQADLDVHLNTTFSIASSKKIKLLFVLNFVLSVVCMLICFGVACYYWHELSVLRRQVDTMKDHLLIQHLSPERLQSALQPPPTPQKQNTAYEKESREPRTFLPADNAENTKKFFVEDLGNKDLLFVDSKKKKNDTDVTQATSHLATIQKDLVIAQFNGASPEANLGSQYLIGPWKRDENVSSKNSNDIIELNKDPDYVVVKETGLYLIYSQVTYLTHAPNCYFIWAHQTGDKPRLLSMCGTGDDSSQRALSKAQISCATNTVARLNAGDSVNLSQREANRTLLLKSGYSFFGFIKLAP